MSFSVIFMSTIVVSFVSAQSPSDYPTTRVPGACGSITQFDCGNGTCIPFTSVRNCFRDCPNGADEECGTNQALCDIAVGSGCGKCVATADAPLLCLDQRYVRVCERGISSTTNTPIFKCTGTSNCVPMDWINDGTNDCGDFSDEDPCMSGYNCTQVDISAPTSITFCTCKNPFKGNGTIWTANDPMYKLRVPGNPSYIGNCTNDPLQFDCGSTCININLVRNCVRDCPNGADEACWAGSTLCSDGCTCSPSTMSSLCNSVSSTTSPRPTSITTSLISSTTTPISTTSLTSTNLVTTISSTTTSTVTSPLTTTSSTKLTSTGTTGTTPTTAIVVTQSLTTTGLPTTASFTTATASTSSTSTTRISSAQSTATSTSASTSASSTSAANGITTNIGSTTKSSVTNVVTVSSVNATTGPRAGICSLSQFSCSNGQCILDLLVMDGKSDCSDGSDERCPLTCATNQTCFYQPLYHNFTCGCPAGSTATADKFCLPTTSNQPRDCADLATIAATNSIKFVSGVYIVYKTNCATNDRSCLITCTCDMDTDGGGYTVVQHRQNPSVDFNRTWDEYKNGFNLGQTDFWQGNDFVSSLTNRIGSSGLYTAIIQITFINNTVSLYKYDRILVAREAENYQLTLGTLVSGDVDNLMISRNRNFATFNKDVQTLTTSGCAAYWQSGWWFDTMCRDIGNLNVPMVSNSKYPNLKGIDWPGPQSQLRNVSSSSMMIRPSWYIVAGVEPPTVTPKTGQNKSHKLFAINKCLLLMNLFLVQTIVFLLCYHA